MYAPPLTAETDKWKKISYAFIPFCGVYAVFVAVRHFSHHHEPDDVRAPPVTAREPWMGGGGPARMPRRAAPAPAAAALLFIYLRLTFFRLGVAFGLGPAGRTKVPVDAQARQGDAVVAAQGRLQV